MLEKLYPGDLVFIDPTMLQHVERAVREVCVLTKLYK